MYLGLLVGPYNLLAWLSLPAQDLGTMSGASVPGALRYLLSVGLACGLGWLAYLESRRLPPRVAARIGLIFAALFAATLVWIYPLDALDVFDYAMHGRILSVHGGNPYVALPIWYPDDPFLPSVGWKYFPSVYGPVWEYLGGGLARTAGDSLLLAVLLFKGVAAMSSLACVYAVQRILARWRPERLGSGTVLLGWNPLLVVMAGSAHNDVPMMALLLGGLWLAADGRRSWGLWLAGVSILVKAATAPVLPILALGMLRHDGKWRHGALATAFLAAAALATVGVALVAPLWPGSTRFGPLLLGGLFTHSPLGLARDLLVPSLGEEAATARATQIGYALLTGLTLAGAWRARSGPRASVRAAFDVLFWLVFLGLGWWQPWYVVWLVCLAPLDDRPWVPSLTWLAGLSGLVALFDRFFLTQHWLAVDPVHHDLHTLLLVYAVPVSYALAAPWLFRRRREVAAAAARADDAAAQCAGAESSSRGGRGARPRLDERPSDTEKAA